MLVSMTGFGESSVSGEFFDIKMEVKSFNSRYLDIDIKMPKNISYLEIKLNNLIKKRVARGKVIFFINLIENKPLYLPELDNEKLKKYLDIIRSILVTSEIIDDIKIDHLLKFDDIIKYKETVYNKDDLESLIIEGLTHALDGLELMREREGEILKVDILKRLDLLAEIIEKVEMSSKNVYEYWVDKFKMRMKEMNIELDKERIISEAAFYAGKSDIYEELERSKSHIKQFAEIIEKEYPCGKKLDFLCQEFNREFNTIASKSSYTSVINDVIAAKNEIDKIREQVQNIV